MSSDIILPPSDGSASAQGVTHILELLKKEFPDYDKDRHQRIAAAGALVACLSSVGAYILATEGPERFEKFKRFVFTNVDEMSHAGAKIIRGKKT